MTIIEHMKGCQFSSVERIIKYIEEMDLLKKELPTDEIIEVEDLVFECKKAIT